MNITHVCVGRDKDNNGQLVFSHFVGGLTKRICEVFQESENICKYLEAIFLNHSIPID